MYEKCTKYGFCIVKKSNFADVLSYLSDVKK